MILKTALVALGMLPCAFTATSAGDIWAEEGVIVMSNTVIPSTETEQVETAPKAEEPFDWAGWAKGWLSPETISMLTMGITVLTLAVKCIGALKGLAKDKNLTAKDVGERLSTELNEKLSEYMQGEMAKYLPDVQRMIEKQSETLATFAKILALSQDNSPEARLAVLKLIEELGLIESEAVVNSKKAVVEAKEAEIAKKEARKEAVAEVVKETEDPLPVDDGTVI